jgi:chromatin remodeling complex protein RSC6
VVQLLLAFINTPSSGCGEKDEKNREKTKRKRRRQREENKKKEREKEKKRKKRTLWFYLEKKSALPPAQKTNLSPSLFWRC